MRLAFIVLLALGGSILAAGQKKTHVTPLKPAPSIVGTWIIDPRIKDPNVVDPKAWFKFGKDGILTYQTRTVKGRAKYTMKRYYGRMTILDRNGMKPRTKSESTAELELTPDGKTLLIEASGSYTTALRLVRKK